MLESLRDKKIAVLGLGENHKYLVNFFDKNNIKYDVLEWKRKSDLIGVLDSYQVVFRTPGFPYLAGAIVQAKDKGVEITSQTKLFFDLCPCPIIGVTGTKGKGTTATLVARILEAADHKVWLGGNIGTDPFEFIDFINPRDIVVLELSSFQLQDLHKSPHVGVLLNITIDHLDESGTYEKSAHGSIKEYFDAKLSIIANQKADDYAVISHLLPERVRGLGLGQKIIFQPEDVSDYKFNLFGKHNLENIAAAVAVAKIYKVPEPKIRQVVKEFKGLPHRLQVVGNKDGIIYVDDSISTNEDSTVAAINAFKTPIVLILGGSSKGLDYKLLGKTIRNSKNILGVVLIGEEAQKILKVIEGFEGTILTNAKSMAEVVKQAQSIAKPGTIILLSPAAASFDMFKNYKDRAQQFIEAVGL